MAISPITSTTASLVYSTPPPNGVKPITDIIKGGDKNYEVGGKTVTIENARGKEDTLSLDTTGFEFVKYTSKLTTESFLDDEIIQDVFYKEAEEIIKKATGASRVVIYDHTIRRRKAGAKDLPGARQPVAHTHNDQTSKSATWRVHHELGAEAPRLLEKRFQIINLWRPIGLPALDWPLALCDARSVKPDDLFPVTILFPGRDGETMAVKYNPDHKWSYLNGMSTEELVLFKCYDSLHDGSVSVYTPHTGFEDPLTPAGTPPRESIELRTLVFYD